MEAINSNIAYWKSYPKYFFFITPLIASDKLNMGFSN